jgi:uncharacterized protein (DUF2267 family)
MSVSGVTVIDRTIHETNFWLRRIMDRLKTDDQQRAFSVLRVVLHIIRDCLPTEHAVQFSNHLPMLIRGLYYEGWRPSHELRVAREHALGILETELRPFAHDLSDIEEMVTAVIDTILDGIDESSGEKLIRMLPPSLQKLWLTGNPDP